MEMSFVLLFAAWEAALTALRVLFRKKEIKPSLRAVVTAAKYLAAIAFAVLVLAGPVVLRPAQPLLFACSSCGCGCGFRLRCFLQSIQKREKVFNKACSGFVLWHTVLRLRLC